MNENSDLYTQIHNLPREAGIYIFYSHRDKALYVGKSKCLRNRVKNYFGNTTDTRPFVHRLEREVGRIEFIVTDTEKEALILENNLIKKLRPTYNVMFRDDSSYVSLKIDTRHSFPRVMITRRVKRDGALYFGPYTSASDLRETLQVIKRHFMVRTCTDSEFKRRTRPCLQYQIKRCGAPCVDYQTEGEYREIIDQVSLFLKGKDTKLIKDLTTEMERAAEDLEFERAATLRDKIGAIENTVEKQKVITLSPIDQDVFACAQNSQSVLVQALYIRNGKIISSKSTLVPTDRSMSEVLQAYLKQYYCRDVYVPDEVLLAEEIDEGESLEELLREKKGKKVPLLKPQRGKKMEVIRLALKNARLNLTSRQNQHQKKLELLVNLKGILELDNLPNHIECFDISNIQGSDAVGSQVTFELTEPNKNLYRKYKIRTVHQPDDFSMMEEVLTRRFRRGMKDGDLPDLAVIDGGLGQLGVAIKVMEELGIQGVDVVALAKSRLKKKAGEERHRTRERVFLPNRKEPVVLEENSPELFLLQRLRDEAHRFAITYHRNLRRKRSLGKSKK